MNILVWVIISFIAGVVLGILILYLTKVRSLLKRIEKMEVQSRYDTIYTDPD